MNAVSVSVASVYFCLIGQTLPSQFYRNFELVILECDSGSFSKVSPPKFQFHVDKYICRPNLEPYFRSNNSYELFVCNSRFHMHDKGISVANSFDSPLFELFDTTFFFLELDLKNKRLKVPSPSIVSNFLIPDTAALIHPLGNSEVKDILMNVYPDRKTTEEYVDALRLYMAYCSNNSKTEQRQHIESCLKSENPHIKKWAQWVKKREKFPDLLGK